MSGRGGLAAVGAARWALVMCSRWEAMRTGRQQQMSAVPAVHQGAPTVGDGCARVHPLQRAAAAGRGGDVKSLDEVDVLLAAAQSESPKPPWLTAYAALKHRRLDRLTRHFGWRLIHGGVRLQGSDSQHWCQARMSGELSSGGGVLPRADMCDCCGHAGWGVCAVSG
jgi:hypothetical protein